MMEWICNLDQRWLSACIKSISLKSSSANTTINVLCEKTKDIRNSIKLTKHYWHKDMCTVGPNVIFANFVSVYIHEIINKQQINYSKKVATRDSNKAYMMGSTEATNRERRFSATLTSLTETVKKLPQHRDHKALTDSLQ